MAHQLRAERISDETGGRCQLRADLACLPLERQHLAKSLQREVREQGEVFAPAVRGKKRPPGSVAHSPSESHDTIKSRPLLRPRAVSLNVVVCLKQIPNPDLQFQIAPDGKDIKRDAP